MGDQEVDWWNISCNAVVMLHCSAHQASVCQRVYGYTLWALGTNRKNDTAKLSFLSFTLDPTSGPCAMMGVTWKRVFSALFGKKVILGQAPQHVSWEQIKISQEVNLKGKCVSTRDLKSCRKWPNHGESFPLSSIDSLQHTKALM